MPIRPENRHRYPKNWKEIREKILDRANHKCEQCGIANHSLGYRVEGKFFPFNYQMMEAHEKVYGKKFKLFKVVLTIAHLDHKPENCDHENLRAWCQACHNRYDAPFRAANRKERTKK